MRPLEIVLLLTQLVALLGFALRRSPQGRRLRVAAPLAALVAGLQLAIEGGRWQLAPAYLLGGALLLAWLASLRAPATADRGSRIATVSVAIGAVALAISAAVPALTPVFRLPAPTGPYAVGTVTYRLVDPSRREAFDPASDRRRELMVQVWYPATAGRGGKPAPYVEGAELAPLARLLRLPPFFFDHLKYVTTSATVGAPVATKGGRFPVLIFSPGRGGFRQHNTFQVEELASHGYVVAAMDQPYADADVVFPGGRRVPMDPRMRDDGFVMRMAPYLGQDAAFTLSSLAAIDRDDPHGVLTGRLDSARAGVFGLSLGGMVAAEACRLDRRFRACLVMDAPMPADVVKAGLSQPTMWITRGAEMMRLERWPPAAIALQENSTRSVFESLPGEGYFVRAPGMFHANFSDFPNFVFPPLARALGIIGPGDWRRGHDIVNAYSRAFFDHELKGEAPALLQGPSTEFPDVRFDRRGSSRSAAGSLKTG